jgi:carbamoyltransferase
MKDNSVKILGLSFYYHDAAAVLLIDGIPVAMSEEERFSRKKHDSGYPSEAIKFVLAEGHITPKDLDYVVFYEKPFVKFERLIKTSLATWPATPLVFANMVKSWLIDKIWVRNLITRDLDVPSEKILFSEHHLSHAASAFLCSRYERAAILSIDGIGEWATTTIGIGEGNKIKILKEIQFPHSLGLFYSAFTAFLGFEVNEGEYKVMGMASYGTPKYADKVRRLITLFPDGSFALDLDYFDFYRSSERSYSKKFLELFGKPRDPKSKFFTKTSGWLSYFGERPTDWEALADEQEYYADIAASLQKVTEEAIVHLARAANAETGLDMLCYAGGVALNSVANWRIIEETPFKKMFIQPAAGDAGGALGAALYVYYSLLDNPRKFIMERADYGASYSDETIEQFLKENAISYRHFEDDEALFTHCVNALVAGKVIGWFSGRFEWGPRALGHRSILADPRREDMKDIVNVKVKFREPYRPFAPSVLADKAGDYFDVPDIIHCDPARFMLYVARVRQDKQKKIPAVTHVDGTARPQTVFRETNPRYARLIEKFEAATGVPLLMNTSFNLKGEPIVTAPEDAYRTFSASGIDLLVLENFVIEKDAS